jgi:hypothetical protein
MILATDGPPVAREARAVPAAPRALWGMIAVGIAVRVVLAWTTRGLPYDVDSFALVRSALGAHPLHLYSIVNPAGAYHWPYPPGFLPLVSLASAVADITGGFGHLIRMPAILADAALTWLVWRGLEGRADPRDRLLAAGLVSFGPVFIAISGYATQIDAVAILPALAALLVWERAGEGRRALLAGVLIGIAGAVKTVPLLMVLALAPSARSRREVVVLLASAAAVVLLTLIPFLIADSAGILGIRHYSGAPGMGGISLLLQPNLAQIWLTRPVALSGLERFLFLEHAWIPNALLLAAFAAYAARVRPAPRPAAALLWLMVLAFGSGFFFQYLVWVLPFLLLAGHVRAAALLQAAVTLPMLVYYVTAWRSDGIVYVYVALMLVVWAGWVAGGASIARRAAAA